MCERLRSACSAEMPKRQQLLEGSAKELLLRSALRLPACRKALERERARVSTDDGLSKLSSLDQQVTTLFHRGGHTEKFAASK